MTPSKECPTRYSLITQRGKLKLNTLELLLQCTSTAATTTTSTTTTTTTTTTNVFLIYSNMIYVKLETNLWAADLAIQKKAEKCAEK
jgi:hypothetical protein